MELPIRGRHLGRHLLEAVANTVSLKKMLDMPVEGHYSSAFVSRYPYLAGVVETPAADLLSVRSLLPPRS